jgi:P27 family predicted phage terminase small subunit
MKKPTPPAYLRPTSAAWWKHCVAAFELDQHHLHLLRLACEALDRAEEAREILATHGLVVVGATGSLKPNPAANIARDSTATFQRIVAQLELDDDDLPVPLPANVRKLRQGRR